LSKNHITFAAKALLKETRNKPNLFDHFKTEAMAATNPAAAPTAAAAPVAAPAAAANPQWKFADNVPAAIQNLIQTAVAAPPARAAWLIKKRPVHEDDKWKFAWYDRNTVPERRERLTVKWRRCTTRGQIDTDAKGVLVEETPRGEYWVLAPKPGQKRGENPMVYGVWLGLDAQGNDIFRAGYDVMRIKVDDDPETMW
jgi:hypothetical protein